MPASVPGLLAYHAAEKGQQRLGPMLYWRFLPRLIFAGSRMRFLSADQRGFILIVVLWVVVLLAIIAAAFTRSVQGFVREAAGSSRVAEAQAMADGGAELVAYAFSAGNARRRFAADGSPLRCRFSDRGTLQISVQDTSGRVNVNFAEPRLLAALFAGVGVSAEDAVRYGDRIADYRDGDDEPGSGGAEREDYLAAGLAHGPKNAALDSLLELNQVLGIDPAAASAVMPYVTLHSGSGKLNPSAISHQLTALINAGLQKLPLASQSSLFGDTLPAEFTTTTEAGTFALSIVALPDRGGAFEREAVLALPAPASRRPKFVTWSVGDRAAIAPGDGTSLPPC